jgi:hypothetical protein
MALIAAVTSQSGLESAKHACMTPCRVRTEKVPELFITTGSYGGVCEDS